MIEKAKALGGAKAIKIPSSSGNGIKTFDIKPLCSTYKKLTTDNFFVTVDSYGANYIAHGNGAKFNQSRVAVKTYNAETGMLTAGIDAYSGSYTDSKNETTTWGMSCSTSVYLII